MNIRSKFMSMLSAFVSIFSSDSSDSNNNNNNNSNNNEVNTINNEEHASNNNILSSSSSSSTSEFGSLNEKDKSDKTTTEYKQSAPSQISAESLKTIFEKEMSSESGSENSFRSNNYSNELDSSSYTEVLKHMKDRHKAMSPFITYKAAQRVFKDYVSPNPFFNFLRDYRLNEKSKTSTFKRCTPNAFQLSKKAGKQWRQMSPDEKVYYRAQAEAAKERLKRVSSQILKRYPSRHFLLKKKPTRRYSKKSLSYIS